MSSHPLNICKQVCDYLSIYNFQLVTFRVIVLLENWIGSEFKGGRRITGLLADSSFLLECRCGTRPCNIAARCLSIVHVPYLLRHRACMEQAGDLGGGLPCYSMLRLRIRSLHF